MADEPNQKSAATIAEQNQGKAYTRQQTESLSAEKEKQHQTCLERVESSCKNSAYVRFMLKAMDKLGCNIDPAKHIICEPCDGRLLGGFDPDRKEIFLCENTIYNQQAMDDVLTHELIHAYDYCKVKYDPDNLGHLACTEIRAANLSGDCFFWKENFVRFKFKWKGHQQNCVKTRAVNSILAVRDVSRKEAESVVNSVFDACFNDTDPFDRIPP